MTGRPDSGRGSAIARDGFLLLDSGLSPAELEGIGLQLAAAPGFSGRGGRRLELSGLPESVRSLPRLAAWRTAIEEALGGRARTVRALLFDKSGAASWRVGWHRDTVVPLAEARATGGFSAPSVKAGQPHARAPRPVLERLLALRLHLDDADETNGCLLVAPGSHLEDEPAGRPSPESVRAMTAGAGQALLMRPLLLHASARPLPARRRRVLHLDLAGPQPLPGGLRWPDAAEAAAVDLGCPRPHDSFMPRTTVDDREELERALVEDEE